MFNNNAGLLFFFFLLLRSGCFSFTSYTWIPWFPSLVLKKVNKSDIKVGRCCSAPSAITGCTFELRMEHTASANGCWLVYDVTNLARDEVSMQRKYYFVWGFFFVIASSTFPLMDFWLFASSCSKQPNTTTKELSHVEGLEKTNA